MGLTPPDWERSTTTRTTSSTPTKNDTPGTSAIRPDKDLDSVAHDLYKTLFREDKVATFQCKVTDDMIIDGEGRDLLLEDVERRVINAFADHIKKRMRLEWERTPSTFGANHRCEGHAIVLDAQDLPALITEVIHLLKLHGCFDENGEVVYNGLNDRNGTNSTGPK